MKRGNAASVLGCMYIIFFLVYVCLSVDWLPFCVFTFFVLLTFISYFINCIFCFIIIIYNNYLFIIMR